MGERGPMKPLAPHKHRGRFTRTELDAYLNAPPTRNDG